MTGFYYTLPEDKIALFPSVNREDAKLLVYTDNTICDEKFSSLANRLPANSILIRNVTKVIKARLFLSRSTGKTVEVFYLHSKSAENNIMIAECLIRNASKIKTGEILQASVEYQNTNLLLSAEMKGRNDANCLLHFSWNNPAIQFEQIIELFGNAPLPPYIKRKAENIDTIRYQTTYAKTEGSVAAPTAGLHFTQETEQKLKFRNIQFSDVVLHVGLGTFKPMQTSDLHKHIMHSERFDVHADTIRLLANNNEAVIAVGTTSLRTLESLYLASHNIEKYFADGELSIRQWIYEEINDFIEPHLIWNRLLDFMKANNIQKITGTTSLMITPDYQCKSVDFLLTNFHQPESTLLLIVASMIGEKWEEIYNHALQNGYRFLSYGDACLFRNFRKEKR